MSSIVHRRDFLKTLAAGAAGAALGGRAFGATGPATADALIVLWMAGGMPHVETFDPKPFTPFRPGLDPRGLGSTFRAIPSALEGVSVSEGLPECAQILPLGTLIRSFRPGPVEGKRTPLHGLHTRLVLSGLDPVAYPDAETIGERLERRWGRSEGPAPTALTIGQAIGRLPVVDDPNLLGPEGFDGRCRRALRLVEQGSRFVLVSTGPRPFDGWDSHRDGHSQAQRMMRAVDRPIARLVRDLEAAGRLDRTLVMVASEFSRAAEVADGPIGEPGRHGHHRHFAGAGSILLFGGGMPRGRVVGATASEPPFEAVEEIVTPADLHTILNSRLGLDSDPNLA